MPRLVSVGVAGVLATSVFLAGDARASDVRLVQGDFDGDGGLDYVMFEGLYTLRIVYSGRASTTLAPKNPNDNDASLVLDLTDTAVGDFDGDGFQDLVLGTGRADTLAASDAGGMYVLFGSQDGLVETVGQATFAQRSWLRTDDNYGYSVAMGDFDGDGHDEIVAGLPGRNQGRGNVEVIWGNAARSIVVGIGLRQDHPPLSTHAGAAAARNERHGAAVAVGYFDDDSRADIAIGAPEDTHGAGGGRVYVVYGQKDIASRNDLLRAEMWGESGVPAAHDLMGVEFAGEEFGYSLTTGRLNDDLYDDLVIGAPKGSYQLPNRRYGLFHVVYGGAGGLTNAGSRYYNSTQIEDKPSYWQAAYDKDGVGHRVFVDTFGGTSRDMISVESRAVCNYGHALSYFPGDEATIEPDWGAAMCAMTGGQREPTTGVPELYCCRACSGERNQDCSLCTPLGADDLEHACVPGTQRVVCDWRTQYWPSTGNLQCELFFPQ